MIVKSNDPIVDEIRAVRQEHAAQFDYSLKEIFRDIQSQQKATGRKYIRYPARPVIATAAAAGK